MRIEAYSQIQQIYNTNRTTKTQEKKNVRPTDQLQISSMGRDMQIAKEAARAASDIREEVTAPLKASIEGKALIEKEKYAESISKKEDIMNVVSDLVGWQKEIAECRANIQKTENQIEALNPWLSLDVPMNFEGTGSVKALIGSFSSVMTLEEIYTLTAEHAPPSTRV